MVKNIMNILKKFHTGAIIAGIIIDFIVSIALLKLLIKIYVRPAPIWFQIVWQGAIILAHLISGYITAYIAKNNPLFNASILGALLLSVKIYWIFSPYRTDPVIDLLVTGVLALCSCIFGGVIRIIYLQFAEKKKRNDL